jgi:nucleotide-binding universal stress UspA family protein
MNQDYPIAGDGTLTSDSYADKPLHPKTVMVFLDASPSGKRRAAHAVALAKRWDAHLVGVHVVFTTQALHPSDSYAIGERAIQQVIAHQERVYSDDEAAAYRVGEEFGDLCSRSNVAWEFRPIGRGQPGEEAILNALHSDLAIVGHPEPHGLPGHVSLETIVLRSGTPLLVLPNVWQGEVIGDNVLIAWNAGRPARRAVSDAMSFIVAAKAVTVLIADPARRSRCGEEPGADIALQLARHGAHVNVDRVISNGSSIAEVILSYARQSGSDLLVFGAYSHTRLGEHLLGGTTRTLLSQMPFPVLVSR